MKLTEFEIFSNKSIPSSLRPIFEKPSAISNITGIERWQIILCLVILFAQSSSAADLRTLCDSPPEYHAEIITKGSHKYTVRMGGKIDGEMNRDPVGYWGYNQYWEPNLFVRLENVGDVVVVNPWVNRARITCQGSVAMNQTAIEMIHPTSKSR